MEKNIFTFILESINWGKLFARTIIFSSFISLLYALYAMACGSNNLFVFISFLYGFLFIAFAYCKSEQEYDKENVL